MGNKKLYKFILVFIFLIGLLMSCKNQSEDVLVEFEIKSPKEVYVYYSDEKILLSSNLNSNQLIWKSSLDGELGEGSQIFTFLSSGNHRISVSYLKTNQTKSVDIEVKERKQNENLFTMINELPKNFSFDYKIKECGFCSLQGQCINLSISSESDFQSKSYNIFKNVYYKNTEENLRDIIIEKSPITNSKICQSTSIFRSMPSSEIKNKFYIVNTTNQNEAHEIYAELYSDKNGFQFFVEKEIFDDGKYNKNIDKCIENLVSIIAPRLRTLWGGCKDIDNSGGLSIIFSSTLNSEKKAIGFFNPNDFYKQSNDILNDNYNPYSNEMDIIYVGIPISDDNENFSVNSISATLAHEITHAINFCKRINLHHVEENDKSILLEIFLDEGLGHLSESLCGFGESGGNYKFVNYYLANSKDFSFCKNNRLGQADSVGQRGAVCYFLYWLFNKAGGWIWNEETSKWIDNGGVSFLQRIVISEKGTWESIGQAFGNSTDYLFLEFANALLTDSVIDNEIDPITQEQIFFHRNILCSEHNTQFDILPYSIVKEKICLECKHSIIVNGKNLLGQIYFMGIKITPPHYL